MGSVDSAHRVAGGIQELIRAKCPTQGVLCVFALLRALVPPPGGTVPSSWESVRNELVGPVPGQAVPASVTRDSAGQPGIHFQLELVTVHNKELVWQVRSPETSGEASPSPPRLVIKPTPATGTVASRGWRVCHPWDSCRWPGPVQARPPLPHSRPSPQVPDQLSQVCTGAGGQHARETEGSLDGGTDGIRTRSPVWEVQSGLAFPWDLGASLSGHAEGKRLGWLTCNRVSLKRGP